MDPNHSAKFPLHEAAREGRSELTPREIALFQKLKMSYR
jgi:hypothetical protein